MSGKKIPKKLVTLIIIIVCGLGVYGAKFLTASGRDASAAVKERVKGNDKAPIKIIEFIDFQCSACADGAKYLKEIMQKNPEVIRLELKYFPLKMHAYGFLSAQYAECASRQGKFWLFHDLLIARQTNWKRLTDAKPAFERMAQDVGLESQKLEACLQNKTVMRIIEQNKAEGQSRRIRRTPTYFVNGKMIVGKKSLELEIDRLLEEQ